MRASASTPAWYQPASVLTAKVCRNDLSTGRVRGERACSPAERARPANTPPATREFSRVPRTETRKLGPAVRAELIAQAHVPGQRRHRGRVQGQLAAGAVLAAGDGDGAAVQVDVVPVQRVC